MKVTGIIAEYNPLHSGHVYQLERARAETQADALIVVLSGAFVQRGEPAVLSKAARVRQALVCGADLVLENPVGGVLSSAQGFARSGVSVLAACGVANTISFGSESGDLSALAAAAEVLAAPDFDILIKEELTRGLSYPAARQAAFARKTGTDGEILRTPNNLLGIEYLLAIKHFKLPLSAHTVARAGAAHDAETEREGLISATACRTALAQGRGIERYIPAACAQILQEEALAGHAPVFYRDMERAMLASLRRLTAQDFARLRDVSEGLECKLARAAYAGETIDEVLNAVKSKRYTHSRIKRILMNAYLGLPDANYAPHYIRVLGMRREAAPLVRALRDKAKLPVIQHLAQEKDLPAMLETEIRTTDVWGVFAPKPMPGGEDYRSFPVIV